MSPDSPLREILARGQARRPLVGGHRGASTRAPENTLAAFRAALEDGAELIELDVHLTRDGQLAVIHDADTRRTTGAGGPVSTLTMADLRRLDAGSHRGEEWAGQRIPELGDVLALARGRLLVNVEVKGGGPAAVAVLGRRLEEHNMAGSTIVSSFDATTVAAAAALRPRPLTGLLLERLPADPASAAHDVGAALLHLKHTLLLSLPSLYHGKTVGAPEVLDLLHRAGLGVLAWTANRPHEMERLIALGVDVILSDDPRLLRDVAQSHAQRNGEER